MDQSTKVIRSEAWARRALVQLGFSGSAEESALAARFLQAALAEPARSLDLSEVDEAISDGVLNRLQAAAGGTLHLMRHGHQVEARPSSLVILYKGRREVIWAARSSFVEVWS